MTKMRQADRKREALARKREAATWAKDVGLDLDSPLSSVAVVVEHPGLSQCNYFLFRNMNQFSIESLGVDLSLFVLQAKPAMSIMVFPVLDSHSLKAWSGPLIAVGTAACLEALGSNATRILHYVFEVDFLDRRDLTTSQLHQAFRDPRVTVMTRGKDYRDLIEAEFGCRVREPLLPDCEFKPMIHETLGGGYAK